MMNSNYELIVGDGKLLSSSGWMFYIYYSLIVFYFVPSKNYYFSVSSMLCYTCVSRRGVSSWVLSVEFIWSYGSSNRNEFTFGQWRELLDWWGAVLDGSVFFLSLLVVIHFYYCSEQAVLWINFYLQTMVLWRDKYLFFHHVALIIISRLCCWFHIQVSLISGM